MSTSVGVRELKQQTSKILRRVRERGETIEITYHGKTIAYLAPAAPAAPSAESINAVLTDLNQLKAEISAGVHAGRLARLRIK